MVINSKVNRGIRKRKHNRLFKVFLNCECFECDGHLYLKNYLLLFRLPDCNQHFHSTHFERSPLCGEWQCFYSICRHRTALANRNKRQLSSKLSYNVMNHHCWCCCWADERVARKLSTFRLFCSLWWSTELLATRKLFRGQWEGDKQLPGNMCRNQQYYASCFSKALSKQKSADCKVMIKL